MDPITAFAMAQGALKAIRSGVEFYKECQAAAADVSEVTTEISGHIGKFLDAKTVVQDAAAKAKQDSEDPSNAGNINSQALNNVKMREIDLVLYKKLIKKEKDYTKNNCAI
jgi:hypothetical protein